jgi:signal peptidase I
VQSPPGPESTSHLDSSADLSTDPSALKPPKKRGSFFKELPVLILIAFGLAMLIKTFLVQAFYIPSGSMENTLLINDRVLVNKLVYRFRDPHRGEIVVFIAEHEQVKRNFFQKVLQSIGESVGVAQPPGKDFIKRVIGLPGETVEMRDSVVTVTTVDGKKLRLSEPYVTNEDNQPFGPTTVPPRMYFVMGDNRPNSADSRSILGPVKRSDVIGRAFIKVWPVGRIGFLRVPHYADPSTAAGVVLAFPAWAAVRRLRRPRRSRRAA